MKQKKKFAEVQQVNLPALKALAKITAKTQTRYSLHLIKLQGKTASATDGHMATRLEVFSEDVETSFFDPAQLKPALGIANGGIVTKPIEVLSGSVFPDIDKVIAFAQAEKERVYIRVNIQSLKKALAVCESIGAVQVDLSVNPPENVGEYSHSQLLITPRNEGGSALSDKNIVTFMPMRT